MTTWDYDLVVCGGNITGEEHYLFTIQGEDTCLIVKEREESPPYWIHLLNIFFSSLYLWF